MGEAQWMSGQQAERAVKGAAVTEDVDAMVIVGERVVRVTECEEQEEKDPGTSLVVSVN